MNRQSNVGSARKLILATVFAALCIIGLSITKAEAVRPIFSENFGYCTINGRQVPMRNVKNCAKRQARAAKQGQGKR